MRRDAAEDGHVFQHGTELVGIVGELARVERPIGARNADAPGDRAHGVRVVAGDDHAADALLRKVVEGLGRVPPDLLLEHEERRSAEPVRQVVFDERGVGVREEQNPLAVAREPVGLGAYGIVECTFGPHHLGRTQHPCAALAERRAAPLAAGREGRRARPHPTLGCRERLAQRIHGGVAIVVGGERAQRLGHRIVGRDLADVLKPDHSLGERAGLVEQDDVDPGQSLDRRELLYEHVPARERDGGDAECQARQQNETFRHHGNDAGNDARDRRPIGVLHPELAEGEEHRRREQRPLHVSQDLVDAVDELGPGEREAACFGREPARIRVRADTRGLEAPPARDDDAPRQDLGAHFLRHRVGLAGQHRFVDLQAVGGTQDAVGRDLISADQVAEVIENHLGDGQLPHDAVAHDARPRRVQNREPVERPLRAVLLNDPDQHVAQEHDAEERVLAFAEQEDEHERGSEDRVEPGEHIGPKDLRDRPARAFVGGIHVPGAHPPRHFLRGQPVGPRGGSGTRDSGVAHRANATDRAQCRPARAPEHASRAGTVTPLCRRHRLPRATGIPIGRPDGAAPAAGGRPVPNACARRRSARIASTA